MGRSVSFGLPCEGVPVVGGGLIKLTNQRCHQAEFRSLTLLTPTYVIDFAFLILAPNYPIQSKFF
jgi:hypothetical protein